MRDARRPALEPIAPGVALSRGEVVLDAGAPGPTDDPLLLLRAAAEAAERDVVLAPGHRRPAGARVPAAADPVARRGPPRCWCGCSPPGRGLLRVWETLEETGALDRFLPEWERIRLLPHASAIHRFTVDRHVVETCIEASRADPHASRRPDVLLVAALLHDIGKGGLTEHSVAGEPIARAIADPDGLRPLDAVDLVGTAGALAPAAGGDRDHPRPRRPGDRRRGWPTAALGGGADRCCGRSPRPTPAPASPKAWSTWRAGLVDPPGPPRLARGRGSASRPDPAGARPGPVPDVVTPRRACGSGSSPPTGAPG